jgi:hypothetical protein
VSTTSVSTRLLRAACLAVALALVPVAASAQDAATLRSRHAGMQEKFQNNQFGRPLVLESVQTSGDLKGDVYAIVEHPFAMVQQALQSADHCATS